MALITSSFERTGQFPLDKFEIVADTTALHAIPLNVRHWGLEVYVNSEKEKYQLVRTNQTGNEQTDLANNNNWEVIPRGVLISASFSETQDEELLIGLDNSYKVINIFSVNPTGYSLVVSEVTIEALPISGGGGIPLIVDTIIPVNYCIRIKKNPLVVTKGAIAIRLIPV